MVSGILMIPKEIFGEDLEKSELKISRTRGKRNFLTEW